MFDTVHAAWQIELGADDKRKNANGQKKEPYFQPMTIVNNIFLDDIRSGWGKIDYHEHWTDSPVDTSNYFYYLLLSCSW